jgi:predicted HicB family RNase H-like nuclease
MAEPPGEERMTTILTLRVRASLKTALREAAKRDHRSLNQYLNLALERLVGRRGPRGK